MLIQLQDILRADLVLVGIELLNSPAQVDGFRRAVPGDLQQSSGGDINIPTGMAGPARMLTYPRDRIAMNLSPQRSVIAREYPSIENLEKDLNRLSEVAAGAISHTDMRGRAIQSYGYNLQTVWSTASTRRIVDYLGERLWPYGELAGEGWQPIGGNSALVYADGARRWTVTVQVWPNDDSQTNRLSLSVNLHYATPTASPSAHDVVDRLLQIWAESQQFMSRLDQIGGK